MLEETTQYEDKITKVELHLARQEETGVPLYALHVWRLFRIYTEEGNPILEEDHCSRLDISNASTSQYAGMSRDYFGLPPATSKYILHVCYPCSDKAVQCTGDDTTKAPPRYEHGMFEYETLSDYHGLGDLLSIFNRRQIEGVEKLREPLIKIIMFMCNVDGEENEKQISKMIDMGMPIDDIIA